MYSPILLRFGFVCLLFLAATLSVHAETVTVTIGTDPIDIDWQTATIADLPGPDGEVSFSEAMIATNNTPGHDVIAFALPQSEWQMQWLLPGRAVIQSSYTYFWRAFDAVTIDGTTQTQFTGDSNPDGAEVAFYGGTIYLNAGDSVLRGIDGGAVDISGPNCLAEENTGDINLTFYSGGGSTIRNNIGSTLKIDRSSNNVVVGNTLRRVRIQGGGPACVNNRVGGPDPADRNFITGLGTVNSEGLPSGFSIQLFDCEDTVIENNSIGTTPDGLSSGSDAATMGIRMESENDNTIIRNNRIAGVLGIGRGPHYVGFVWGWGIYVSGSGTGLEIVGNTIGLDANGDPLLGSVTGIEVGVSASTTIAGITIGGTEPGKGNTIAGHRFNGITIGRDVPQARIAGNSIYDNDDLGIDLIESNFSYGVSLNDPMDTDTGGNGLQNFPEILTATSDGTGLEFTAVLDSAPTSEFTIDFFASPDCDASGYGEGEVYLGSSTASTDESGHADLEVTLPVSVAEGWVVTATATLEPLGATSEFSQCVEVEGGSAASIPGDPLGSPAAWLSDTVPSPFRSSASIRYELVESGMVRLSVFDASGRLVRNLGQGHRQAGDHTVVWDATNDAGEPVTAGIYFYQLNTGDQKLTKRALVVR